MQDIQILGLLGLDPNWLPAQDTSITLNFDRLILDKVKASRDDFFLRNLYFGLINSSWVWGWSQEIFRRILFDRKTGQDYTIMQLSVGWRRELNLILLFWCHSTLYPKFSSFSLSLLFSFFFSIFWNHTILLSILKKFIQIIDVNLYLRLTEIIDSLLFIYALRFWLQLL